MALSGDIFECPSWSKVEARDADKHWRMHRTASPERIIQPQMSVQVTNTHVLLNPYTDVLKVLSGDFPALKQSPGRWVWRWAHETTL